MDFEYGTYFSKKMGKKYGLLPLHGSVGTANRQLKKFLKYIRIL